MPEPCNSVQEKRRSFSLAARAGPRGFHNRVRVLIMTITLTLDGRRHKGRLQAGIWLCANITFRSQCTRKDADGLVFMPAYPVTRL
jgi:hypothetical protein